jgi:hypothetical protein
MVMSPAAPDSFVVIFRFGADAGARASGRRRDASYGVIDTSPVDTAWTL